MGVNAMLFVAFSYRHLIFFPVETSRIFLMIARDVPLIGKLASTMTLDDDIAGSCITNGNVTVSPTFIGTGVVVVLTVKSVSLFNRIGWK